MKQTIIICLTIIIIITALGCGKSKKIDTINDRMPYESLIENDDFKVILYDRYKQKLVLYSTQTYTIDREINVSNYMQYEFNTPSDYYTTGHSIENGFEIIRIGKNSIERVYSLKNKKEEAIFPLATNKDKKFFIKSIYKDNEFQYSFIVSMGDNNDIEEYKNTKGKISFGAILDEKLYYTVYEDGKNNYSLYSLEFYEKDNKPVLIKENLEYPEIYSFKGNLYYSTIDKIICDKDYFSKGALNYFDDLNNKLIQLYVDKEGTLLLELVDISTKSVIKKCENVIDFRVSKGKIIIYCHGEIYEVSI